jgi:hypothetical protein
MSSGNAQDQGDIGEQAIADPEDGRPGCAALDIAMMRLTRSMPIRRNLELASRQCRTHAHCPMGGLRLRDALNSD